MCYKLCMCWVLFGVLDESVQLDLLSPEHIYTKRTHTNDKYK